MINTGIFDVNDLIQCYAPPNLREVMPGNKVMLRSGGPEMTVCDVDSNDEAVCQWMVDGKMQSSPFPLECLTCYGAR